jgi:hypothetical protein
LDNDDNPENLYGRINVLYDGERGTICDLNFDNFDAELACKTMGYYGGTVSQSMNSKLSA